MLEIQPTIEKELYEKGASLIGFADMRDLPVPVPHSLPYALSISVALDRRIIADIADGPTRDYYE